MLRSSCVTVESRLQHSVVNSYSEYWIRNDENPAKVPCDKDENHVAVKQIFPILYHPNWRSPTVKHHCPRTAVASSFRAMSNLVRPDPIVFAGYRSWFLSVFLPKFLKYMDNEVWNVDMNEWLLKYPVQYRNKILKSYAYENRVDKCFNYEAFAKIEQQFTEVPHILKETDENTVKERQICGPNDQKKAMANAFINKLEEIAHKYQKEYCGRKNWIEICDDFDKIHADHPNFRYDEEDFSGFDMTQLTEQQELMNIFKISCLNHPNVHLQYPINKEDIIAVFENSVELKVSVMRGWLMYKTQGRASGDGWTTFDNTELSISYYEYTYYVARIENYVLRCKGDDSIKGHSDEDNKMFRDAHKVIFATNTNKQVHGLGQVVKKTIRGELQELGFLSNHFFLTKEGKFRMTRIPARVFQTNSWTTKLSQPMKGNKLENSRRQLLYSKGMCLLSWGKGLPIWEVLAKTMIRLGIEGKLSEFDQYADGARVWHDRDDREAYLVYLHDRYNVTPQDVLNIERKFESVTSLSGFLEIPELEKFYD